VQLIQSGSLSIEQKRLAASVLEKKSRIYGNGCVKRGKIEEGEYYLGLYDSIAGKNL
jgi:hypothetical protein